MAFPINTGQRRGQAQLELEVLVKYAPLWAQTAKHGVGLAWRVMTLLFEGECHLQEVRFRILPWQRRPRTTPAFPPENRSTSGKFEISHGLAVPRRAAVAPCLESLDADATWRL